MRKMDITDKQVWMDVKGTGGKYRIDVNSGQIKSGFWRRGRDGQPVWNQRTINGSIDGNGYVHVVIMGRFRYVHDLVAEVVWEKPEGVKWTSKHYRTMQIDHIDNNKQNNSWRNLRWLTARDNNCRRFGVKTQDMTPAFRPEFLKAMEGGSL